MEASQVAAAMPRYVCHKRVWALKIQSIEAGVSESGAIAEGTIVPELEGYGPLRVSAEYMRKHNPQPGGYFVQYADGYQSFSPAKAFEEGYTREPEQQVGQTFGWAIKQLQEGKKVQREGWNGKGMWLVLMPELKLPPFSSQAPGAKVNDRTAKHIGPDTPLDCRPYIVMWTALQQWQPGWLASQADMLADDWQVVE